MNQQQKDSLVSALIEKSDFTLEFFKFQIQTKVQLSLSQIEFLMTLSSIALAILGIGVGIDKIPVSLWSYLSIIFALVLLILSITLYRETIDLQDRDLVDSEIDMKKSFSDLENKIYEAIDKDDYSIYINYLKNKDMQHTEPALETNQIGEVAVFLIFNTIGFGILSFINPGISEIHKRLLLTGILGLSYSLSFKNWSFFIIDKLTKSR